MKKQESNKMLIQGLKSKIITADTSVASVLASKRLRSKQPGATNGSGSGKLLPYLFASLKKHPLKNGDILVITSKVAAITQGRIKKIRSQKDFDNLVKKEADAIIGKSQVTLTLKNGIFIPWAGIDRSNIQAGHAVLWPEKPFQAAAQIRKELKKTCKLKHLGVIISDSHCIPLRRGVTAIALGYAGFKGVNDLRGHKDLYGNKLKVTQQNVADMLAAAAHLVMGEAAESTPFALIKNAPVTFTKAKTKPAEPLIESRNCLFAPLYNPSCGKAT